MGLGHGSYTHSPATLLVSHWRASPVRLCWASSVICQPLISLTYGHKSGERQSCCLAIARAGNPTRLLGATWIPGPLNWRFLMYPPSWHPVQCYPKSIYSSAWGKCVIIYLCKCVCVQLWENCHHKTSYPLRQCFTEPSSWMIVTVEERLYVV